MHTTYYLCNATDLSHVIDTIAWATAGDL